MLLFEFMPNVIMNMTQYTQNCIFYCEPIKNSIMNDGNFIRIIYANEIITLNGIMMTMPFIITSVCKHYNKCKYAIEILPHELEQLKAIEMNILQNNHYCDNKTRQYNIYDNITSGYIRTFCDNQILNESTTISLKISGIWETETDCGITYKFISI